MTDTPERAPDRPPSGEIPAEPSRYGCLGWASLILAVLLAGFGLVLLIFSGLCTAAFSVEQGTAPLALIIGVPTMLVGYGLWRLGRWWYRCARRPRSDPA